jgi:hypothetical protein
MADDFDYDNMDPLARLMKAIELIKEASPKLWQQLRAEAPAMPMQLLEAAEAVTAAEREQRRWERGVATLNAGKVARNIPGGF